MAQEVSANRVVRFYLPLAANAVLMSVETPVVIAGVSRLPDAELQLAAYGVLTALSWWLVNLGAPLIHTGNTLGRTRRSFLLLRNFSLATCALATLLAAAIYFTPAYDFVVQGLLGASEPIAKAALPGTQLMVAVSFTIGYRRFYQGLLIRHGYTSIIGWCTLVRVVVVVVAVWAGVSLGSLSGATMAGAALSASASVECAVVAVFAEAILRRRHGPRWEPGTAFRLDYGAVLRFYAPLAVMMLLTGMSRPVITAAMNRLPEPILSLAAFPVAYGVFNLVYAPLYPLVQIIIALVKDRTSYDVVVRFARAACLAGTLALFLATLTPAVDLYLSVVLGVPSQVRLAAVPAAQVLSLYFVVQAFHNEYQGLLVAARRTLYPQIASAVNMAVLALVLALGVVLGGLPGVVIGSLAYVVGFAAEAVVLRRQSATLREGLSAAAPSIGS